jgi:hypothetical protein
MYTVVLAVVPARSAAAAAAAGRKCSQHVAQHQRDIVSGMASIIIVLNALLLSLLDMILLPESLATTNTHQPAHSTSPAAALQATLPMQLT